MSLNYRQRCQLHRIEAGLRRADPHLGVVLGIFGRLYSDQEMPGWEQVHQVPASQSRLRRVGAWIVAVLTAAAVAISVLIGKAITRAASARRARAQAPVARRERTRPRPNRPA
jgi:hypothetical protein